MSGLLLMSCADSKRIVINGESKLIEPYGWWNPDEKHDSVKYRVVKGNVVWSILTIETIAIPLILTGGYLYEPVEKK